MQQTVAIVAAALVAVTTYAGHILLAETPHYSTWSAPLNVESAFPGTDPTRRIRPDPADRWRQWDR